ncbi:hypothetical protein MTO96_043460, partial [Rhipicephalus appendiculatus]
MIVPLPMFAVTLLATDGTGSDETNAVEQAPLMDESIACTKRSRRMVNGAFAALAPCPMVQSVNGRSFIGLVDDVVNPPVDESSIGLSKMIVPLPMFAVTLLATDGTGSGETKAVEQAPLMDESIACTKRSRRMVNGAFAALAPCPMVQSVNGRSFIGLVDDVVNPPVDESSIGLSKMIVPLPMFAVTLLATDGTGSDETNAVEQAPLMDESIACTKRSRRMVNGAFAALAPCPMVQSVNGRSFIGLVDDVVNPPVDESSIGLSKMIVPLPMFAVTLLATDGTGSGETNAVEQAPLMDESIACTKRSRRMVN